MGKIVNIDGSKFDEVENNGNDNGMKYGFDFVKMDEIGHMPNQKWHKIISLIKSVVRIGGYCLLPFNLIVGVIVLVVSELIGIIEELV